jgi:hypothetical protein
MPRHALRESAYTSIPRKVAETLAVTATGDKVLPRLFLLSIENETPHNLWGFSRLVSSFSCSDLVRSPTEHAESQISSETITFSHLA